jgi:RimJ/RimL family protein N-acetyltransferase
LDSGIVVRPAERQDLDALCSILALPEVAAGYFGVVPARDVITTVLDDNRRLAEHREGSQWVACATGGAVFAYAALVRRKVVYFVHPSEWNKGYASALVRYACEQAFGIWPARPVAASVFRENRASARLLEKLGFRFTGLCDAMIVGQHLPTPMLNYELVTAGFRQPARACKPPVCAPDVQLPAAG